MRFKRHLQEAIGYLQKKNTLNQPLLSSKDVPISPATQLIVGKGVYVSNAQSPFDRSVVNIGTLPERETLLKLEGKMKAKAELLEDWEKRKKLADIKNTLAIKFGKCVNDL